MGKISIGLSADSIEKAAKQLADYARGLRFAAGEIDHSLSVIAAEEAASHFDENVSVAALEHGVMAVGDSVVFQEFGAGARISDPYPDGADVGFEIRRGAYSDLHEGEYAQTGYQYWHHDGEIYQYVTPTNGLFHGMMAAKERAAKVAKEALSNSW